MSSSELRGIRILTAFSDAQLEQLAGYGGFLDVPAGQGIIRQGDRADGIYFLVRGKAASYFTDKDGAQTPLVTSEEGSHFGELALLQHGVRTASVRASTPCRLFRISRESFEQLLNTPAIAAPLLFALAQSMALRMTTVTERLADARSLKNAWL